MHKGFKLDKENLLHLSANELLKQRLEKFINKQIPFFF